jgi:hypothetical protein
MRPEDPLRNLPTLFRTRSAERVVIGPEGHTILDSLTRLPEDAADRRA